MANIVFERAARAGRMTAAAATMASAALLLALAGAPREAEATFPGENGKIAFASNRTTGEEVNNPEGDFEIFTMNADGTGLEQLTENAALDLDPEWSADGEKIAFVSERDRFSDIFVMNADGSEQTNVTDDPAFDSSFAFSRSPTFSPNGERIAFDSNLSAGEGVDNPTGDLEIFAVNLDGASLTQLTDNTSRELHPDFSPDGKKIAFVSDQDFRLGVYAMDADGTNQKKRTRGAATVFESPSWSPGGRRITFASNQDGGDEIYVMRANGSAQKRLTNNGIADDGFPVFSPDRKRIVFQTNRDGNFEIYAMTDDGKKQTNLTNDPAADLTPDWQPLEKERH